MRLKFKWFYAILLALFMQVSFAQTKNVTGVVGDGQGPLPGATVAIKGTSEGTQTDFDGKYSINVKQGDVLLFSFVGMDVKEVIVGTSSTINVTLVSANTQLTGVVIEGYRQTTKVKSANAVVTVSAGAIEDRPNANFIQTLQGQVAGLQISTGSGQPGANSTVILRGYGSLNGNSEPLYVIDGIQMNTDNFRSLNPYDIESVSVLKDAGATAIYGNRGGNGVIVITTKGAKFGQKLNVSYNGVTGMAYLQNNDYKVANTKQILQLERIYGSAGAGVGMTDAQIDQMASEVNTNWFNEFFRKSTSQSHNLSITAGNENVRTFTSFSYFNQEGILKNTGITRVGVRSNTDGKSKNSKFTYGTKLAVNFSKNKEMGDAGTGSVNWNPLLGATNSLPYISPKDYTGSQGLLDLYLASGSLKYTPLMLIDVQNVGNRQINEEVKTLGSAYMSYEFLPNFTARTQIGADYNVQNLINWVNPISFNSLLNRYNNRNNRPGLAVGSESQTNVRDIQVTSTSSINYNNTFSEKHTVNASAFFEFHKANRREFGGSQSGMDPIFATPGSNAGWTAFDPAYPNFNRPTFSAAKYNAALVSFFANADYDYLSKYGVNATVRRDGSYRFADEYKWGTFWSVSARWNITSEAFMDGTATWLNELKLRASYGTNGNQLVAGQSIYNGPSLYLDRAAAGRGYNNQQAILFSSLGYATLQWEVIKQANIGLDFSLFDNRLVGSLDVYDKKTDKLYQSTPLSAITGFESINSNFGSLRNRGAELFLNYHLVKNEGKGFNLKVNFNGAYNKNQLLTLPSDDGIVYGGGNTIMKVGDRLSQWYLYDFAGINPTNGEALFYDKNNNLTENPTQDDRKYTGKSAYNPKFQGGFGFDIDYKNFFVNTLFTYVTDIYRMDYDLSSLNDPGNFGIFNVSTDMFRSWTPENRYTDMPSMKANNRSLLSSSQFYLEDASYLRLRNVMIGYNFDKQVLEAIKLSTLRIYLQGENLVTFSKWRGWDAESNRASDQWQYPTPRSFSFGVQIGL